jgi:hypothetical protein
MRLGRRAVVPFMLAALGAAACTRNPYVIGSVCPPEGGVAADPRCATAMGAAGAGGGTFAVALDHSGTSALGPLVLPGGATLQPSLRLRGERATATEWTSDAGTALARRSPGSTPGLPAPFTDDTAAVGFSAPSYVAAGQEGALGADDFVLELVARQGDAGLLFGKQSGAGWSLQTSPSHALTLDLDDGAGHAVEIASHALTVGAWYHCLFWVSRAAGGRADCDGTLGDLTALPALGAVDVPAALAAGGNGGAQIALFAVFRAQQGGLGDAGTWLDVGRRRFAALAGVLPGVAGGTPLPQGSVRATTAYLDLQAAAGAPRALFLVGEGWPRVVCRVDGKGARVCGYLSEPARRGGAPADPPAWQPAGLTVAASATPFLDGEPRWSSLAPSTAATTHALLAASTAGSAHQVFSFFVHPLTATRVAAGAADVGAAVFDLAAGQPVSAPANARATIETWAPGVFRCSLILSAAPGPETFSVRLLDDAGAETFAGAGAPTLEIAGLQVDDGLAFAGSLLAVDMQAADVLTFVANDGNLPAGPSAVVELGVLAPDGPRLYDQAIVNLNAGGAFDDQVQLYLRGDAAGSGRVAFWGLNGGNGKARWAFDVGPSVTDGDLHTLRATWDDVSAQLLIDGMGDPPTPQQLGNPLPSGLDRIDVGFSQASSRALEGLVTGLRIGAM